MKHTLEIRFVGRPSRLPARGAPPAPCTRPRAVPPCRTPSTQDVRNPPKPPTNCHRATLRRRLTFLFLTFLLPPFLILLTLYALLPRPPLLDGVSFSRQVLDRHGQVLRITLSRDGRFRLFTPLAEISPELIRATELQEDRYYDYHPGINPVSAFRSAVHFCLHQGRARGGASTLSMQLARLRFGLRTRTVSGKLGQGLRALELERHYTKSQLLEAYFNLAPYGHNVEGVGAASRLYFGKSPAALSRPETVALSVIPQSPARRAPRFGRENPFLTAGQNRLYERLISRLPAAQRASARLGEDFRAVAGPRPFLAPHFTNTILQEVGDDRPVQNLCHPERSESASAVEGPLDLDRAMIPPGSASALTTTLDLDLQRLLESRTRAYLAANHARGFVNAAAMLVDVRNMEVLAQLGSADFFDSAIDGQVDGTRRPRSPGSALKPFIYALAMDQGLIHPQSLVMDAPHRFGDYNPENFDREFAGPLSAADALGRSRNVPAVALAAQLTRPTLYEFLQTGGVHFPRGPDYYGLALPLGGAEVTMEDLVRLYATLANQGRWQPLRRLLPLSTSPSASPLPPSASQLPTSAFGIHPSSFILHPSAFRLPPSAFPRLLSPEAAFLTLEMLGRVPPPGFSAPDPAFPVFWKTGTSHGFRDAWSVAVFDHYVLAVWLGRFDGRGNAGFVGRTAAAPLLFGLIDALRAKGVAHGTPHEPPPGANLRRVELCAVSGCLPTAACRHRTTGWFIPGVSPVTACAVHREILLDRATGLRVPFDDGERPLRREIYEFWPASIRELFARAGLPRRVPPPFLPGSGTAGSDDALASPAGRLRILAPRPDAPCQLRPGTAALIPLRAHTEADATRVYWFAGHDFLGASAPQDTLCWPQPRPGTFRLTALDDQGRADTCTVTLQVAP